MCAAQNEGVDQQSPKTSLQRGLAILRAVAGHGADGARLSDIARDLGMTPPTTHRLLKVLVADRMVDYDGTSKRYRLGLDLFVMAAQAGACGSLRDISRPILLRLSATLRDTVFLLVRSGFDAVCLDRADGPFPISSFTGDVGGRVMLGVGQGSLAILSHLPEEEQQEVIRFNLPRMQGMGLLDEVYLHTAIARTRRQGFANQPSGMLPGVSGVGVPIFDHQGRAVAALSIGTLTERLTEERLGVVVSILQREAASISRQINPFDKALTRPATTFGSQAPQ
ncbi:IclR family transcriptional regulator [Insolitispirillum peregrinum]|uniref:Transcriptional regulator, IclR family n=1 Tax=Insolitispirillum peregrinum TaxID=80876 RepID=A0A1N7IHN7_9PROT|nr:IclR family transcriptional regulator [Insolitispirillum peregrinum]SIS36607.1 transcriptional regulator, IclR family [Insolitispirillum peregrinum]